MKRKLLGIIGIILFSSSAYSNTTAFNHNFISTEQVIEKSAERQALKSASKTVGRVLVAKSVWKNKKVIIGGTILLGVGGFAGYKITKEKFLDIIESPEDHEDFMQSLIDEKPLRFNLFKKFINYNIDHTKEEDYKQALINFEEYFKIYKKDKIKEDIIISPEYKNYLSIVSDKAKAIKKEYDDNSKKKICDLNFYSNLVSQPIDFPPILNLKITGQNKINRVDRYGNFVKIKKDGITPDHIPSYKSVEIYLSNKGLITSNKRADNQVLEENLTAISIPSLYHKEGSKTFFGRNLSEAPKDSLNLLKASIEDIAFFSAYLVVYKHENPINYLNSSYTLLKRNFYLCLYENQGVKK